MSCVGRKRKPEQLRINKLLGNVSAFHLKSEAWLREWGEGGQVFQAPPVWEARIEVSFPENHRAC